MTDVVGLFPTPLMRIERLFDEAALSSIVSHVNASAKTMNAKSSLLSHTEMIIPNSKGPYFRIAKTVAVKVAEFGALLFGEALQWSVKEMWVNILETGGSQAIHNHANSFVSGVIYVTDSHPSANTVFVRHLGSAEFVYRNSGRQTKTGPFNGDKWIMPCANAGYLVLFPSYLLHEVPVNQGGQRITVAFNAIPDRIDSWGYSIRFAK